MKQRTADEILLDKEPSYIKGGIHDPEFVMPLKTEVSLPVYAYYKMVSAKYIRKMWDVEIQIDCPSVHGWVGHPLCVGHITITDSNETLTPVQAFMEAVKQICLQNAKTWRPILARDSEV